MNKDIDWTRPASYVDLTAKGCDSIEYGMYSANSWRTSLYDMFGFASVEDAIIARIKSGLSSGHIEITALRWEK